MIAHHTLGGCNLRPGDLLGSGTVSGGGHGQRGCLLEATSGGKEALHLRPLMTTEGGPTATTLMPAGGAGQGGAAGVRRVYLEDGDEVVLSGWCRAEGRETVSFGECRGLVLPCHAL
jgi:fumarylacetoacetase